jgi:hypothetical protein
MECVTGFQGLVLMGYLIALIGIQAFFFEHPVTLGQVEQSAR